MQKSTKNLPPLKKKTSESISEATRATELAVKNKELLSQNLEKEKRAAELLIVNLELAHQNQEKEKRAAELLIANLELAYQNQEKENRAAELQVANMELAFQNQEKENRAAELQIANRELAFQNQEKENRAAELQISNRELAFQNQEKGKRAAELLVANRELAYQNQEKEKRAAELQIANRELDYQNQEKENRAAELLIANQELSYQNQEKEDRAAELVVANDELARQNIEKEEVALKILRSNIELKEIQKQLIDSNAELESFSYSVSHDLRAPLRAIIGFSVMLQEEFADKIDIEGTRIINVIVENAQMMSRLIDDLLRFSRMARLEAVNRSMDVNGMVKSCIEEILQFETKSVTKITVKDLPNCHGDESMLRQVWFNLISNAVKYSSKNPHPVIEIGCNLRDDMLVYFITDNGSGFDMKYYHKLFGVFQRLHSQAEFEGTGLGLALVKRILQKHGGKIWAESVVGEGTTFYFSIPNKDDGQ